MEEQRFGVGVVEQVDELVFEVAVVHVHRDAAHLERRVHALDVLVAVVEVRRDLGARLESRPRRDRPRGARRGRRTRATCAGVRPCAIATRSGSASRHRLPQRREVPVHGLDRPRSVCEGGQSRSTDTLGACHRRADSSGSRGRRPTGPAVRHRGPTSIPTAAGSRSTDVRARLATPAGGRRRSSPGAGQRRGRGARAAVRSRRRRVRDPDKRPETMPSHQGEIAFPGGKHDPALDADLRATALREAHEEIGLDPDDGRDRRPPRRHRDRRVPVRDHAVRRLPRGRVRC